MFFDMLAWGPAKFPSFQRQAVSWLYGSQHISTSNRCGCWRAKRMLYNKQYPPPHLLLYALLRRKVRCFSLKFSRSSSGPVYRLTLQTVFVSNNSEILQRPPTMPTYVNCKRVGYVWRGFSKPLLQQDNKWLSWQAARYCYIDYSWTLPSVYDYHFCSVETGNVRSRKWPEVSAFVGQFCARTLNCVP